MWPKLRKIYIFIVGTHVEVEEGLTSGTTRPIIVSRWQRKSKREMKGRFKAKFRVSVSTRARRGGRVGKENHPASDCCYSLIFP